MENNIYTVVVMNSGREYIFDQDPEEVITRVTNPKTGDPYNGFVHLLGISLNPSHISSIEEFDKRKVNLPIDTKFYRAI